MLKIDFVRVAGGLVEAVPATVARSIFTRGGGVLKMPDSIGREVADGGGHVDRAGATVGIHKVDSDTVVGAVAPSPVGIVGVITNTTGLLVVLTVGVGDRKSPCAGAGLEVPVGVVTVVAGVAAAVNITRKVASWERAGAFSGGGLNGFEVLAITKDGGKGTADLAPKPSGGIVAGYGDNDDG